jgi:hypothetical protein
VLAVVAAGCGDGGGGDAATTSTGGEPSVVSASPQKGPDGLESLVKRCQVSTERSTSPDVVPGEFKPSRTRVISAARTADGFAARLLYDHSVTDVYAAIKQAVQAAGYEVVREENEGRDAELFLTRNGTPSEVRLSAIRACPQYATASVSAGGEGNDG